MAEVGDGFQAQGGDSGPHTKKRRKGKGGGKGGSEAGGDGEITRDHEGTVRMFNADKGWGFIDGDTCGKDIFLHSKHFAGKVPNYWIGHKMATKDKEKASRVPSGPVRVLFDMSLTGQGKPQALNVRIVSGQPSDDEDDDDLPGGEDDEGRIVSPTCESCGSTIATSVGLSVCILCGGLPKSRR
eukprot:TRINITY_DN110833_c0_g1_i1.p1 TRINITY_DN110833_c0_g1~~TRINITY_DN110833_c0_g1_i1.p1  ORF type:complete len:206 (+),score=45.13 TRINITY_DN110833_c0_g1_i1:68-619(+)